MLVPGLPISDENSQIVSKYSKIYAEAFSQLNIDKIGELFDDDIIYDSDTILDTKKGKEDIISFLRQRWRNIKSSNKRPHLELAKGDFVNASEYPCIIGYQRAVLISLRVKNNKITAIYTHTFTPDPNTAKGSNIFY